MAEFKEYSFTSAHKFLEAIRLSNNDWWPHQSIETPDPEWQRDWIFRGQSSAKEWKLLPAAWRPCTGTVSQYPLSRLKQQLWNDPNIREEIQWQIQIGYYTNFPTERELSEIERKRLRARTIRAVLQVLTEVSLINEFTNLADELGFSVSKLGQEVHISNFISNYLDLYFPDNMRVPRKLDLRTSRTDEQFTFWEHPTIALAQHHGITTRLLDWTHNPITAAFFAAKDISRKNPDDHIAVNAFHKKMLIDKIRLMEVPASSNDFLRAQAGLFTVDLNGESFLLANGRYPSLEDSVRQINIPLKPYESPRKFLLTISEAPTLMRLLWLERVTHAHLMPTLDHVAEAVQAKIRLSENLDIVKGWK